MDKFLYTYIVPRLTHEEIEIEIMNIPINELGGGIKDHKPPKSKPYDRMTSLVSSTKYLKDN